MKPGKTHYDEQYFAWQRSIGELGGRLNVFKFREYIRPTDRVLDFGCGGGYILQNIECGEKHGIEVNPTAAADAELKGIVCHTSTSDVDDAWADVLISHSALEHVPRPLDEIIQLRRKLRPDGLAVFCVPCESWDWSYQSGDINQHLYTWSPMSLGNLFATAGFHVKQVDVIAQAWPPASGTLHRFMGDRGFRVVGHLYWRLRGLLRFLYPVKVAAGLRVVAVNPASSAKRTSE